MLSFKTSFQPLNLSLFIGQLSINVSVKWEMQPPPSRAFDAVVIPGGGEFDPPTHIGWGT